MEETRMEEIRNDEMSAEIQSEVKPRDKKRYSLKIQKAIATLLITVGMAVAAFCSVRLLTLALNTDALDIHMDDWLENKAYGDSDTLALHMVSDMDDVITYMGLQQILEEDGVLNLERPALVVQQEDGEIVTYTAQDLVALGEKAGIYVYDEISENGDNQLECFHNALLKQKAYHSRDFLVIGIAGDYSEAVDIITKITQDCVTRTGGANVKQFLLNEIS